MTKQTNTTDGIFLVGGAVRDQLLNYPYHERDWVVVGRTAQSLLDQGYCQVGKDFPVFLHPKTKEEYALARQERKSGLGYHGFEFDTSPDVTLEEDLLRRDLTINAIAKTSDGLIIDPYHGQDDIEKRILRHVSPAFREDPLRVLRTARFAARYAHLGFTIAPETLELMHDICASDELCTLSKERIWAETASALTETSPAVYVNTLTEVGAWHSLLKTDLQLTTDHLQYGHGIDSRWALLCSQLTPQQLSVINSTLKVPNSAKKLSQWLINYLPTFSNATADIFLQGIQQAKAEQNSDFFDLAIELAKVISDDEKAALRWYNALKNVKAIEPKNYIEQGYTGADLGQALRQAKLSALEQL